MALTKHSTSTLWKHKSMPGTRVIGEVVLRDLGTRLSTTSIDMESSLVRLVVLGWRVIYTDLVYRLEFGSVRECVQLRLEAWATSITHDLDS